MINELKKKFADALSSETFHRNALADFSKARAELERSIFIELIRGLELILDDERDVKIIFDRNSDLCDFVVKRNAQVVGGYSYPLEKILNENMLLTVRFYTIENRSNWLKDNGLIPFVKKRSPAIELQIDNKIKELNDLRQLLEVVSAEEAAAQDDATVAIKKESL